MSQAETSRESANRILASLHSARLVGGFTHDFYRYPARMSPDLAREIIRQFSEPGDVVLDPFMGGATTIVEAVAGGRRAIGVDLNSLAQFIGIVKTTPLSATDSTAVRRWADTVDFVRTADKPIELTTEEPRIKNLPPEIAQAFAEPLHQVSSLPFPRQRRFARCVLLRLGQWAVDGNISIPRRDAWSKALSIFVEEMLAGLDELVDSSRAHGVAKGQLTGRRSVLLRSAVGIEDVFADLLHVTPPRLVLTSPPYPAMHVLYHRWQVHGRRETPAPYWFIGSYDGRGAAHYTLGSRTPFGLDYYFETLTAAYRSVRKVVAPDALVVQLVSFSDAATQLSRFLAAMEAAGFGEVSPIAAGRDDLWRTVPNRKWYYRVGATRGSTQELLLFHRPA